MVHHYIAHHYVAHHELMHMNLPTSTGAGPSARAFRAAEDTATPFDPTGADDPTPLADVRKVPGPFRCIAIDLRFGIPPFNGAPLYIAHH